MQRLRCVGLLLLLVVLLAGLCPVVVAIARREMLMAASSDEGRGRAGAMDSLGKAAGAASDREGVIGRRKDDEVVVRSHRRFRTRKIPASQSQVLYGGRIPFTADYHSVRRHPPTHN
ncbi:unnamed protein product [Urochloa humidicola]